MNFALIIWSVNRLMHTLVLLYTVEQITWEDYLRFSNGYPWRNTLKDEQKCVEKQRKACHWAVRDKKQVARSETEVVGSEYWKKICWQRATIIGQREMQASERPVASNISEHRITSSEQRIGSRKKWLASTFLGTKTKQQLENSKE